MAAAHQANVVLVVFPTCHPLAKLGPPQKRDGLPLGSREKIESATRQTARPCRVGRCPTRASICQPAMEKIEMKIRISLLSSALLLAMTSSAFAASSVDLTVKGVITPSACTPNLPGDIDYGKIAAKDLSPDSHTWLEHRTLKLSVNCDAATLFAIRTVDNRAGSSTTGTFGLGLTDENEKLGGFELSLLSHTSETPSTALIQYPWSPTWTVLYPDDGVTPNTLVGFGGRSDSGWAPQPLQDVVMDISVRGAIAPTNTLTLDSEVAMDGSATFEVNYL